MQTRNCPKGYPFAIKISDVTPIKDDKIFKKFDFDKIETTKIDIKENIHKNNSNFVKCFINLRKFIFYHQIFIYFLLNFKIYHIDTFKFIK